MVAIDGCPPGLHARRRVGPRHGEVALDALLDWRMVSQSQRLVLTTFTHEGNSLLNKVECKEICNWKACKT